MFAPQAHSVNGNNTCVTLEFADGRFKDDATEVNEDGYVHISFALTDNCQPSNEFIRVKVSTRSRDLPKTFCTIVFQENICKISDQSLKCHCIKKEKFMFTSISTKISLADKVLIEWNDNHTSKGETSVSLFVNGSKPVIHTDENIVTPVIISIGCCILVAVVFVVIVIKRHGDCRHKKQQGQSSEDRQMILGNIPPDVTPTSPANLTNIPTQTSTQTASGHSLRRTRTRGVARLQGHKAIRSRIGILTFTGQRKPNNHGMTATQNQTIQEPVYDRAITFSPIIHRSQGQSNDQATTSGPSGATRSEEQEYDRTITFCQSVTRSQEQANEQVLTHCQKVTTSHQEVYDRAVTFTQTVTRSQDEIKKHVVTNQKPEESLQAGHGIQPNSNQNPTACSRSLHPHKQ
ncbi:hypothetical protein C0Q70_12058 [Pomacea canaliculata]|uniref:Uncharacterized protein n=2 Tax=Pomacea canaliculata TaxID=400727 RepID=A0A2T7P0G4_POMCA|nr:hypothetical protein C0Q70_12058 [Pomacea canaliculata]